MNNNSTKSPALQSEAATVLQLLDDWFDPIEAGLPDRVREFIQTMIEAELEAAVSRPRYGRRPKTPARRHPTSMPRLPRRRRGGRAVFPATGTATDGVADGDLWPGRDRGAARRDRHH